MANSEEGAIDRSVALPQEWATHIRRDRSHDATEGSNRRGGGRAHFLSSIWVDSSLSTA